MALHKATDQDSVGTGGLAFKAVDGDMFVCLFVA